MLPFGNTISATVLLNRRGFGCHVYELLQTLENCGQTSSNSKSIKPEASKKHASVLKPPKSSVTNYKTTKTNYKIIQNPHKINHQNTPKKKQAPTPKKPTARLPGSSRGGECTAAAGGYRALVRRIGLEVFFGF